MLIERIYRGSNIIGSLTLIEKLIEIMTFKNVPTLAPLVEKLIKQSADITLHTNISHYDLVTTNYLSDSTIKMFIKNYKGDLFGRFFGDYHSHSVTIDAMDPLGSVTSYIQKPETMNTFWKIKYKDQKE